MAAPKKSVAPAGQATSNGATPSSPPDFTRDQEMHALRDMLLIRRFEEKAGQLYGMGADRWLLPSLYRPGSCRRRHADGEQEGRSDVITGYRDHGHMLAWGMDPRA
jgi:pyruvate dehydrogenase E1 component alpha subunit